MLEGAEPLIRTAGNIILLVVIILIIGGIFAAVGYFYWLQYRRFKQYKILVWEKDGFNKLQAHWDDGAVFMQGSRRRLWLRKANVSLSADNIPYMNIGKDKVIEIYKAGAKNFVYIYRNIDSGKLKFTVGEEDVNWAVISWQKAQKSFGQTWFMQFAPYALVVVSIMVVFAIFYLLIQKMDAMVEISKNVGIAMKGSVI